MNALRGIAALIIGITCAALVGIAAGWMIGALLLALPFALAWDFSRKRLQRRGPTRR